MTMLEEQKQALKKLVEDYITEAEEAEDDVTLQDPNIETRKADFVEYLLQTQDIAQMTRRVPIENTDNRDFRTTWLWLDGSRYIEVDPIDLVQNAVENLPEEEQEHYSGLLKNLKDG